MPTEFNAGYASRRLIEFIEVLPRSRRRGRFIDFRLSKVAVQNP